MSLSQPFARVATLLAISSGIAMSDATLAPVLPRIAEAFADTPGLELKTSLILTLPALTIALTSPIAGWIADRMGRKPLLVGSLLVMGLAGSAGWYVATLDQLLISRALMGLAVGGIMTGTTALFADYFADHERRRLLGYQAAALAIGGLTYQLAAGELADRAWRLPFLIYLLPLVCLPFAMRTLSEPAREPSGRAPVPLANCVGVLATGFLAMVLFYFMFTQLAFHFGATLDATSARTARLMALSGLFSVSVSVGYDRIRNSLSRPQVAALLFALVGLGYLGIGLTQSYLHAVVAMALTGLGFGMLLPTVTNWMAELAPPEARGRLMGALSTAMYAGQFVSPLIAAPIIERYTYNGLLGLFGLGGCCAFVVSLVFLAVQPSNDSRDTAL